MPLSTARTAQALSGVAIGLYFKWDLALVALAVAVFTYTPAVIYLVGALDKRTKSLADAYAAAGGVASEVLSGLRTVTSLGLQPTLLEKYEVCLRGAEKAIIASNQKIAFAVALMNASMFYVLASGSLYTVYMLYKEYKDSEFEYSFGGDDYYAHSCDAYDLLNVDFAATGTDGTAPSSLGQEGKGGKLARFLMTCASGKTIAREPDYLKLFTYSYSGAEGAREEAFDDQFGENGSSSSCSINLAVLYVAVQVRARAPRPAPCPPLRPPLG